MGSGSFRVLETPRILLLTGSGVSAYEAGETWHLLDRRFSIPVTLVDVPRFESVPLSEYTTIVVPSGDYRLMSKDAIASLSRWLQNGGTMIGIGSAARWIVEAELGSATFVKDEVPNAQAEESEEEEERGPQAPARRPYAAAENDAALKRIRGAILETEVDTSHPLGSAARVAWWPTHPLQAV